MTPAPVAVVRNISTAAEGRILMTDDELQQTIKELSEGIDTLSKSEKPLTRDEKKYRGRLLRRRAILSRIMEAREKNQKDEEIYHAAIYEMLMSWGEGHPVLMGIMMHFMRIAVSHIRIQLNSKQQFVYSISYLFWCMVIAVCYNSFFQY